ncbi:GLE1-domain-containing protein [Xylona heveae TC161]|uniref:mRNA export factor GLE1 n=1 Tax=Xylona heveae (strain CBS 132557 / TC161) TaxID=1328760 RepID=A0A165JPA3_XYLHT|nr:GLE1-domain-containing protein [Xylona heveae TC161]KZF26476.1 GLE1-domain-containing protein [Xylona heveae TC161]
MSSPWKSATDSPSRQLLLELGRIRSDANDSFYSRLDEETLTLEAAHRAALVAAAAEHERVRQSAEIAREQFELELERQRRIQEESERRELERRRREKAERDLRELEEQKRRLDEFHRAEAEKRRVEEEIKAKERAEEERRRREEQERVEAARRREAEEAEARKKAQDAAAAAQAKAEEARRAAAVPQAKPIQAPVAPQPSAPAGLRRSIAEKNAVHQQYAQLHRRLKELRSFMVQQSKQNPVLKKNMGDMRREIKKCVGQLTEGKGTNRIPTERIKTLLKEASSLSEPAVDVRQYIVPKPELAPLLQSADGAHGPGLLVYLLNIFAKAIISQFINESSVSPKSADPIGVVAASVFSSNDFRWKGVSLIDILMAKFHVVCPVLWGIYGSEKTEQGRQRLGWWREEPGGPWISEQRHNERMTGLGSGFAAIALRNFEKSPLQNPYPNIHYWRAVASIVNVPPQEATGTHFVVLKAMIENYEGRFLEFYGHAALVALKKALVAFPRQATNQGVAAKAVTVLADVYQRDKRLTLAA